MVGVREVELEVLLEEEVRDRTSDPCPARVEESRKGGGELVAILVTEEVLCETDGVGKSEQGREIWMTTRSYARFLGAFNFGMSCMIPLYLP